MRAAASLAAAAMVSACAHVGPSSLSTGRALYNEAVQQTDGQQLLLNIVRQRYNDPILFLEISSISSSSSRAVNANLSGFFPFQGTSSVSPGVGVTLEETPLIFYAPSNGEKFVRQVLTPLDLATLTMVLQAGWSIERVLLLIGESINDIRNSTAGAGRTGATPYQEFRAIAAAFRELQRTGDVTVGVETGADEVQSIALNFTPAGRSSESYKVICRGLAVACDGQTIRMRNGLGPPPADSGFATIATRSLYSAIYFLAEGVEVPPADVHAAQNRSAVGGALDPKGADGSLFRVRSSASEPADAAVKVKYRESWFYIADADSDSKVTFALLSMLLMLQAGENTKVTPLISLPAN
jgi:hypothetical protein